ncbi:MAG: MbnH family di-heme enzyme [Myxococcota bacterium]
MRRHTQMTYGRLGLVWASTLLALGTVGCADDESPFEAPQTGVEAERAAGEQPSAMIVPDTFPDPSIPSDNVPTEARVDLGRHLFYDTLLSGNETYSCGTCHQQALAFTDGLPIAEGSTGESHSVGSMSLANAAYPATLGWGNPTLTSLEAQALVPMFGEEPVELGLAELGEDGLLARLREQPRYQTRFPDAFPGESDPFTVGNIARAIASFQRTMISANSPYDKHQRGEPEAMSPEAQRGMALFFSERLECFHCHSGFNFSDSVSSPEFPFAEQPFHNNGMYNVGNTGAYPENQGVYELTGDIDDQGKFKAPTLRNIAVTAPYLHDGSVETLPELIDLYAAGGRNIVDGDLAGDGTQHPNKSTFVVGFELSDAERADLLAFLEALTDEEFLTNPALSDPYEEAQSP